MKKYVFLYLVSIFFTRLHAQIDWNDYKDSKFYVIKTESDFFSGTKNYRGIYIPSDNKIIHYQSDDGKKRKLNLEDSCQFYFGIQIGDEILIRPNKGSGGFTYYTFGGGNINTYCVVYGNLANYDKEGYLQGLTSPGGRFYMYYVDKKTNKYMVQLDELLSSQPELLKAFKTERSSLELMEWQRNKLRIGIKYLKLFIGEKH